MVDLNVLVIALSTIIVVLIVCIELYTYDLRNKAHIKEKEDKDREVTLKQAEMEFKIRAIELKERQNLVAKPTENKDPEKASESDLRVWFEIMADPDKLFEDRNEEAKQ